MALMRLGICDHGIKIYSALIDININHGCISAINYQ